MTTPSMYYTMGIPMGLLAVVIAVGRQSGIVDDFIDTFWNQYDIEKQASVIVLVFGISCSMICIALQLLPAVPSKSSSSSRSSFLRCIDSNNNSKSSYVPQYPLDAIAKAETELDQFKAVFPMIKREILDTLKSENELLSEAADWIDAMMEYSVPGGKLNRGTTVVHVYKAIQRGRKVSAYDIARAAILGWSIELLQAFFLVADDIMDDSHTRRGNPCWFRLPTVGMIAINDSFLLESFVFQIIRTHFGTEPYYSDICDLLLDVIQKTEIGQLYDLTSQPMDNKTIDLSRFTMERYHKIVQYKTAYYSFYLPVAMGLLLSGIQDVNAYHISKDICCRMGEYFQIQDDYLDCYGAPEVIGKVGTDIQDNKCSWLIVQALNICTQEQRILFQQNYGQNDPVKIRIIQSLYNELQLPQLFEKYEEESYQNIERLLNDTSFTESGIPRIVFDLLLQKIYKRSK